MRIKEEYDKGARSMQELDQTVQFPREKDETITAQEIIKRVYEALYLKGYDPVNQLVGYIISGDPTYITSYNSARYLIRRIDRQIELAAALVVAGREG